jgi:hypothetical protein
MADTSYINALRAQLAAHRATLAHLRKQLTLQGGETYAPPATVNGIAEARLGIAQIKAALLRYGMPAEDLPDEPGPAALPTPQPVALPLNTLPDPAPLPPGSRMPLRRNPLFVGRENALIELARTIQAGGTAAISQLAAATGMGGIGKTNLATEFVYRYGQFFVGGVFWLSFADAASVPAEVAACGGPDALDIPHFSSLKLEEQVVLVRRAWDGATLRLLVFDNCEDEALLEEWCPQIGGARVLLTSRQAIWDPILGVQAVRLDVLRRIESIALLRAFRPDLSSDDLDLAVLAAELGDLPLALHVAGSFLAKYHHAVTPAAYMAQLRSAKLFQHPSLQGSGRSPTGHDLDVGRTFALSFDRLDREDATDALALDLLLRAAYFAPGEPIPRDLLTASVDKEGEEAAYAVEDSLRRLVDLGLIETMADGAVRLHRLIVAFAVEQTSNDTAQVAVERVLLSVVHKLNATGYPAAVRYCQLNP